MLVVEAARHPAAHLQPVLLTSCTILAAVDITLVYLPAVDAECGIEASAIGLLLTIRGVASMTSRLFLGRLTALIGRRKLLITGTLVAAVALAGASLPVSVAVITILMPLAGLGLGVGQPITMSWLAASAPSGARGRAMSLRLVGNRAGQVVLPSLAGALAAGTEAAGVLCATGAKLAVIAAAARTLSVDEPRNPQPHADSVTRGGRTAPSAAVPPLFADTAELSLRRP